MTSRTARAGAAAWVSRFGAARARRGGAGTGASACPPFAGDASAAEIVERCLLALVNETAWALGDGVVADAAAVDLALVLGTGFAPWTGGPCRWADAEGAGAIVERLRQLATLHGERFTPAPWLVARVAARGGFYDVPAPSGVGR